ncbi:MAG TPA: formylglycine-generating enzyme family protein [Spirochaetota bacterium]|nr:formylglycine-generating enzyme family protein [Spirochaetota bacterium]
MNRLKISNLLLFMIIPFITCSAREQKDDSLVLINGGTFDMGSPTSEAWRGKDELPHRVTLKSFYMGKFEVTQKEYSLLTGENPSRFKGNNLPVENITWYDAVRYCNMLSKKRNLKPAYTITGKTVTWNRDADGYRLPTEAEWEYACRAGTETPFNTAKSISPDEANYYGTYPYMIETYYFQQKKLETRPGIYREKTVPVGSFAPNRWGLYDMHGNVWEWCWDWYGAYSSGSQNSPEGPASGTLKVNRGGGWNDFAKHLRSAYRSSTPPDNISFNIGFRVVRNAD